MTTVLVSDIIEQVRVRLNLPTPSSDTFLTSTEVLNLVKFSARRLSGKVRREGSDFFTTVSLLTTTPSVDTVALPTNCTDVRKVAWMRTAGEGVPMERAGVDDWLAAGEQAQAWNGAPMYVVQGSSLRLFPCPTQAYSIALYHDTGIFVTATGDEFAVQPGWEEWIVLDVCIRYRQAEEKDASEFVAERGEVEAEVLTQARARDRYRTAEVRDLWDGGEWADGRSLFERR